jgi:hypothetical protein
MNGNLLVGRSLFFSRPAQVSEFGQEETSFALVGSATTSCPDPNLARGLTRAVSDPYFSNSRGRALVSERHRKPFGGLTPLHHVPSPTGKTIRPLHAIRRPVAQSEGRPRAHWTRRRPCAE